MTGSGGAARSGRVIARQQDAVWRRSKASNELRPPACAIAAGAATIYRNYFAPVGVQIGQNAQRQLDALAGLGAAFAELTGLPVSGLWTKSNGYALCTAEGLQAIGRLLDQASENLRDELRGHLGIGLHRNVEVTDVDGGERRLVSQAFCSALQLGYSSESRKLWEPFARLVLEATYEATLLAAAEQADAGGANTVLLTRVGGGVFNNDEVWITTDPERALLIVEDAGLDVRIVGYRVVSPEIQGIVDRRSRNDCAWGIRRPSPPNVVVLHHPIAVAQPDSRDRTGERSERLAVLAVDEDQPVVSGPL